MTAVASGRGRKFVTVALLLLFAVAALFYIHTCTGIVQQAHLDERRPADAIVVFGAAEYYGRPSPVLRARLDHGLDLFRQDMAPFIVTTGGKGKDPRFSEGGVGHDYLAAHGVPDASLIEETMGGDTAESARACCRHHAHEWTALLPRRQRRLPPLSRKTPHGARGHGMLCLAKAGIDPALRVGEVLGSAARSVQLHTVETAYHLAVTLPSPRPPVFAMVYRGVLCKVFNLNR